MRKLLAYFLRGLVLTAPIAITAYVCWALFVRIDGWLRLPIPGAGFVVTIALLTLFGFIASNVVARSAIGLVDRLLGRLPFVRLLYGSTRDLLNAFVGEQRRFDKPVLVTLVPGGTLRSFGFLTQESLARFGLDGDVAVYLPQSYNVAGNLLVVPRSQVTPLDAVSSDLMAFIVSGGVTGMPGATGGQPVVQRLPGA
jgi:uncharacterized membrane protein